MRILEGDKSELLILEFPPTIDGWRSFSSISMTLTLVRRHGDTRPADECSRRWLDRVSIPTEAVAAEGRSVAMIVTQ